MPSVVTTVRGTGILTTETRRVRDVSDPLVQLDPDSGAIFTLSAGKIKPKQTMDFKFEHFEDSPLPRFDTLGADLTAGATTMTTNNFARFRAGDLVQINDKEIVRITATPTSNTVTIVRGKGTTFTSGVAASSGQRLRLIAGSAEEGSVRRDLLSTQKVPQFNYTQEFKMPFGVTRRNQNTKTFGGKDIVEEQAKAISEIKRDIEFAVLIGEKYQDNTGDVGTHPQTATQGVIPFISTNRLDVGGSLTQLAFEKFLIQPFRFTLTKEKVLIGSPIFMTVINSWAREKLRLVDKKDSYGVTLHDYMNAGRRLMVTEHPLMTNDSLSDFTGLAAMAVIMEIADFTIRFVGPKLMILETNIQLPGTAGRIDQYYADCGMQAKLEQRHAVLTGVTE